MDNEHSQRLKKSGITVLNSGSTHRNICEIADEIKNNDKWGEKSKAIETLKKIRKTILRVLNQETNNAKKRVTLLDELSKIQKQQQKIILNYTNSSDPGLLSLGLGLKLFDIENQGPITTIKQMLSIEKGGGLSLINLKKNLMPRASNNTLLMEETQKKST